MTQADWLTLVLKAGLVSGFISLAGWVVQYTVLTRGRWTRNPIGRTLVAKTALIAALFVPTALTLFFRLNRADSLLVGWLDAGLIGLVSPVMVWRMAAFARLHRQDRLPSNGNDGGGSDGAS